MATIAKVQDSRPRASLLQQAAPAELVIITGRSGSGKQTVLKAFEDLGFYAVDNLPIALVPKFADLTHDSKTSKRAALIIDVREGESLKEFPGMFRRLRRSVNARLLFLDASDEVLQRRFSETRRPHPLGREAPVMRSLQEERELLAPLQNLADITVDTSKLNVHELRTLITRQFRDNKDEGKIVIQVNSFGFRNGVPHDSDLVFDVRFLPNPNFIPEFKKLSGRHPSVARYIRSFPQTREFINRISDLLIYLLPHYIREGKSYLTISFGCTGGRHRSVLIASEIRKRLVKAGFTAKETHRDIDAN
ncbi:MAG: RNase adapter RapZ [Bryobacteraceae bacterium]